MATLEELLADANAIANAPGPSSEVDYRILARAVLSLLAPDGQDCGMPTPTVAHGYGADTWGAPRVIIPDDAAGPWTPDDARRFARALLAAADEADSPGASHV